MEQMNKQIKEEKTNAADLYLKMSTLRAEGTLLATTRLHKVSSINGYLEAASASTHRFHLLALSITPWNASSSS